MVSFLWKTSRAQRDFGKLAIGTCNLEGRLPPLMAGSHPYAGRTWWKNDIPAIWCERIKMNDGHGDWKILFSNALHCCCCFNTQRWCWGGRCRTCCRGARRRTAWFSPGTIVFRLIRCMIFIWKSFLTFFFLARQSISMRILTHFFW